MYYYLYFLYYYYYNIYIHVLLDVVRTYYVYVLM